MRSRLLKMLMGCVSLTLASATAFADSSNQDLERFEPIREVVRAQENTGHVFVMAHRGEVVLVDFAGDAVIEHDIPITRESRFPIMSITKAFTGTALSIAVNEGLVDLDVPIGEYLADYSGPNADRITLRQLAAHTSGIPHTGHPDRKALYVEHFNDATEALKVVEGLDPVSAPGEAYRYSSAGYNLIAAVIEARSGLKFTQYVEDRVIRPLGLDRTEFTDVMKPQDDLVRNYSYVDIWTYAPSEELQQVPTWDFSYNLGGGNMISSADDLLLFGEAFLEGGRLSPQTREQITSVIGDPEMSPWTAGWITGSDEWGRRTVHITGATPGVQAALYVYPDDGVVFAMLANSWGKGSAGGALVTTAPQRVVDSYLRSISGQSDE